MKIKEIIKREDMVVDTIYSYTNSLGFLEASVITNGLPDDIRIAASTENHKEFTENDLIQAVGRSLSLVKEHGYDTYIKLMDGEKFPGIDLLNPKDVIYPIIKLDR